MASNIPIALRDICPIGVVLQPEESTGSALIRTLGQDDRITVAEFRTNRCRDHIRALGRHRIDCAPLADLPRDLDRAAMLSRVQVHAPMPTHELHQFTFR